MVEFYYGLWIQYPKEASTRACVLLANLIKKMQYNLVQDGKLVCPYVFVHQSVCL